MVYMSENQNFDSWHLSRKILAESYLKTLSSGVLLSTTLFAPEKTGLSSFLINDLLTLAEKENYVTLYIDLSDRKVPVTASMLVGLERLLMGTSVFRSGFNIVRGFFKDTASDVSKNIFLNSSKNFIDEEYFLDNFESHMRIIKNHLKKILSYGTVLMVIDHAENINSGDVGERFIYEFRGILNENNRIKPLYATSQMDAWANIFKMKSSPLNSEGAFIHKLPPLGKVFLREAIMRSGRNLKMEEALYCFEIIDYKPGVFLCFLNSWNEYMNLSFFEYIKRELSNLDATHSESVVNVLKKESA